jgi:hypothetical protein
METGRNCLRPVFYFLCWRSLVAVPAAEAIVVAADSFTPLEAVVRARVVEATTDFHFVEPGIVEANDATIVTISIGRLCIGRAREEKSTTQYGRS